MAQKERMQIPMPYHLKRMLALWAHVRNQPSIQTWICTVLALRSENAWPKIDEILDRQARHLGIDRDELEKRIMARYGVNFEQALKELED